MDPATNDSLRKQAATTPLSRNAIIDRVTSRAWHDPDYRELLFENASLALQMEFGVVPDGFHNVAFRRCDVDRAVMRQTPSGPRLRVRRKRADRPLSVVTRTVFGIPELVVVFYSRRCRYQCSFCVLPSTSALSDVSDEGIAQQLENAFVSAGDKLSEVRQVSLGNEGSILDAATFSRKQLASVLTRCVGLPRVDEIVLETRAEFVTEELLGEIQDMIGNRRLTLKIGLESSDTTIRERILRKRMDLGRFEEAVAMLGVRSVGLASYVLVKADPSHDDAEGRADALRTCDYLKRLCRRHGVDLTLRINSMYSATGSMWARQAAACGWEPPSIFDIAEVMWAVRDENTKVFAGLYDEGLAAPDGHYEVRGDFRRWALDALERYNQSEFPGVLEDVATYRGRLRLADRLAKTSVG